MRESISARRRTSRPGRGVGAGGAQEDVIGLVAARHVVDEVGPAISRVASQPRLNAHTYTGLPKFQTLRQSYAISASDPRQGTCNSGVQGTGGDHGSKEEATDSTERKIGRAR
jgi:hypothetical protein